MTRIIGFDEGDAALDWLRLTDAIAAGHRLPRAEITDALVYRGDDTILNRTAWIDGLGALVKVATIFPGNAARNTPTINGAVTLYDDADGTLAALVDFHLVTKWKTAGDSLLAARRLARPDSETILVVGAGTVGASLIDAYRAGFPKARITLWNRNPDRARALARAKGVTPVTDLETAVRDADIVTSAVMTTTPLIQGAWLKPGAHLDLIGAYRPDMREADDTVLTRGHLFVDSRDTTLDHIGELKDPLARGVITRDTVIADFYDPPTAMTRPDPDAITVFKNGGGAHLDLMVTRHILDTVAG